MRSGASRKAALALTTLLAAATAQAQEPAPIACKAARGKITVQFKPDTTVADLARWITATTCRNVVMDATLGARAVTVLAPTELTSKQAVELFVDSLEAVQLAVKVKPATLIVTDKATPCRAESDPTQAPVVVDPDLARYITVIDATHFEVKRALLDEVLANPQKVANSARVVPAVRDGKPDGFKLYAIRPRSVYAALGFMNGDTIHAVNGMFIASPEKALEAYQQLKTATQLKVSVTRRGKPMLLEYTIK